MLRTYGFLSTYPPTQCGLATFTAALLHHLTAVTPGSEGKVVRVLAEPDHEPAAAAGTSVVHQMTPGAVEAAAEALNRCDMVVVQHEYGIYAGRDGADVLSVLARLRVPVIIVLHTVLTTPTPGQRQVLEEVVGYADAVVTMSEAARQRLVDGYAVARPDEVVVIPHGALPVDPPVRSTSADRPMILTWGLLGRGKGIEWAISALGALRDLKPRYLVAGQTHPKVLAHEGETYRRNLRNRAAAFGVADLVEFDPTYLEVDALRWRDEPGLGDWWGRALWGLGTTAARCPVPWMRTAALARFEASAHHRPPSVRSMAFAALGAAEVLSADPRSATAARRSRPPRAGSC